LPLEIGGGEDVHLRLDQLTSRMRVGVSDVATDLLEIAAFLFAADQALTRGGTSEFDYGDKWRRTFRFEVPVRRPDVWDRPDVRSALVEALGFLTDDEYEFGFRAAVDPLPSESYLFDSVTPDGTEFDSVILFSGGLDSLCGAVEEVLVRRRRAILVSHRSSTRVFARQQALFDALSRRVARRRAQPLHVAVTVNKGEEHNRDFNQRSRSFVFAAVAAVVARQVGLHRVQVCENGVTSLNLPVSPELIGARASRTTHPQSLTLFGRLFSLLFETEFEVHNPYQWKTKAQMLERLREQGHADLCKLTCSCGHVWGREECRPHCGRCSQCVDRRVTVLAAGLTDAEDPTERYESDPLIGERSGPELTFAERYVGSAREVEQIDTAHAFAMRYPEVYDAIPFTGLPCGEALEEVYSLYRRHADAVARAIQHALAVRVGDLYRQAIPGRSLLGAVLGRAEPTPDPACGNGIATERGFVVDRDRLEVRMNGLRCPLGNNLEFRLIERLHRARGVFLPIETIGEDVWDDAGVSKNSIQAVVSNLRRRLREVGIECVMIDGSQKGHYRLLLPSG
jgi:7-cyano-7-deazaguanine synthase in queuosine biosynthesis